MKSEDLEGKSHRFPDNSDNKQGWYMLTRQGCPEKLSAHTPACSMQETRTDAYFTQPTVLATQSSMCLFSHTTGGMVLREVSLVIVNTCVKTESLG